MSIPSVVSSPDTDRPYRLEQIDDAAVVQLYADGFEELTAHEKILVWHLYQAAVAGRDIYYDQRYRHNLPMRDILEEILTHPHGIAASALAEITRYTKLFWINSGPYNNLTARKFVLRLSTDELIAAAEQAAANGACFPREAGESVASLVRRYAPMFLDALVDPMVTCKTPGQGRDILTASANNLYDEVSMADLEGVAERYPINSRLAKRDGRIVEEVYRIGGLYDGELSRIVRHLRAAVGCSPPSLAAALTALVRWYETGEDADREAFDIAWVQNRDSAVDMMNGFIEVYMDARGIKGAWEGVVYYVNHEKTEKIHRLAQNAQWFEDHLPIDARYRKAQVQGISARAIEVVIETGDSGPVTPIGVNLPNDQRIREQYGSKSVSLSNVIEAYERSTLDTFRQEFCWDEAEIERAKRWGPFASELTTEIHEVLGHGSGRMAEHVTVAPQEVLKEQYSALEESRADLVALYFVADPYLAELGLVPAEHQEEIVRSEYEAYARNALVQLRRVREGTQLEEDHMRNRQAIAYWLMAHTRAIETRRRDGKTYYVLVDAGGFREGAGLLLREVQRIKSEGDYDAARELFEAYGVHFDAALRDEVVARVDHLRLPSYTAFVMPKLEPVGDDAGNITDVTISYPGDLMAQMLDYSAQRRRQLRAWPPSAYNLPMRLVLLLCLLTSSAFAQPALRERMLIVEDQRASSSADVDTLKQGLSSRDPATRRQAVRAVGRLERPDLMPLVSRLLTDPNHDVRIETINAIGQMAKGADGVAAARTRLLARVRGEQVPRVRGAAAATLGRLQYTTAADVQQAERAIAPLVPMAASVANLDEIAGAVEGLEALIRQSGKLAPPTADTLARLRAAARIEGRAQDTQVLVRIRRLATAALTAAGRVNRELLEAGAADPDDEVRRLTMVAARADIDGREAVVAKGLGDTEARVRYAALQSWGRSLQKQSCAPVLTALRDANEHVRLLAIDLLGNGCAEPARAVAVLHAMAQTITPARDMWHAPAHAIVSLAKVAAAEARPLLPVYVTHPVWQVRMYAARAAGALQATEQLIALARDGSDNVREAALSELAAFKSPAAAAVALEALTRRDYQLLITAARALGTADAKDRAAPALLAALSRVTQEKRDTSRDARMAMLNALDQLAVAQADALRPYLRDFDRAVAQKAADLIQKWTNVALDAVPQPLAVAPVSLANVDALRGVRLKFVIAGKGVFDLGLLVDEAPLAALRVATRARERYYNGLTIHRVVPNFVVQGGSPGANEYAGDGPYMRDEVGLVSHRRGTVGISTRGRDTGDAQIFINLVDLPQLDHNYTVFAEVVSGMEVVDRLLEGDIIERVDLIPAARSSRDR
jgi:dipeptidyl-peptidase-3